MPIRAAPYRHQRDAFEFSVRLFGAEGGDAPTISPGAALLMEMGRTRHWQNHHQHRHRGSAMAGVVEESGVTG